MTNVKTLSPTFAFQTIMKYLLFHVFICVQYLLVENVLQQRSLLGRTEEEILHKLVKPSPGEGRILISLLKKYTTVLEELLGAYKRSTGSHVLVSRIVQKLYNRNGPRFIHVQVDLDNLKKIYWWSQHELHFVKESIENTTQVWMAFKSYFEKNGNRTSSW
uniref:Uncharacterized protein n=1 Tax=Homalodisca liturata TaxID=320908 RepID=A0A1B6HXI2_9HEMI